jgi:hypothetical protein
MQTAIAMKKPKANVSKTVVCNKSHMDPNVVCYKQNMRIEMGEMHYSGAVRIWNYKSQI